MLCKVSETYDGLKNLEIEVNLPFYSKHSGEFSKDSSVITYVKCDSSGTSELHLVYPNSDTNTIIEISMVKRSFDEDEIGCEFHSKEFHISKQEYLTAQGKAIQFINKQTDDKTDV
ncbi:hypothetical protein AAOE16_18130 [Ekhidna sp. MALMAid0563]|uniref:hypothetical protein n=1 Tax=Ekhidna sp. MALMAid0563 TaxID=3143937 RepID=UPI0032DE9230